MWAAKQKWRTGFTIVFDSVPGSEAEVAFARGFTGEGGKIVRAERVRSVDSVEPFVQARQVRPDVLFVSFPAGPQAAVLMRNYDQIGLRSAGIHLVGPQDIAPDNELAGMGEGALGLITSGNYSSAARRKENIEFLAAWLRVYGDKTLPDFTSVAAWDGMAAIFEVVRQRRGRFSGDQAMEILKNWSNPNSPRGPMSIDPETRETIQNIYIRRVEAVSGRLVNIEFETVPLLRAPLN